jgi:hypothetical protein
MIWHVASMCHGPRDAHALAATCRDIYAIISHCHPNLAKLVVTDHPLGLLRYLFTGRQWWQRAVEYVGSAHHCLYKSWSVFSREPIYDGIDITGKALVYDHARKVWIFGDWYGGNLLPREDNVTISCIRRSVVRGNCSTSTFRVGEDITTLRRFLSDSLYLIDKDITVYRAHGDSHYLVDNFTTSLHLSQDSGNRILRIRRLVYHRPGIEVKMGVLSDIRYTKRGYIEGPTWTASAPPPTTATIAAPQVLNGSTVRPLALRTPTASATLAYGTSTTAPVALATSRGARSLKRVTFVTTSCLRPSAARATLAPPTRWDSFPTVCYCEDLSSTLPTRGGRSSAIGTAAIPHNRAMPFSFATTRKYVTRGS